MKDLDANKALAWISIVVIAVSSVVTFSKLFTTVESHEARLGTMEKKHEAREEILDEKLQKIQSAIDFSNWRMDTVVEQLKEKKR